MPTRTSPAAIPVRTSLVGRIRRGLHPLDLARARGTEALRDAIHSVLLFLAVLGGTYRADYPAAEILLLCTSSVVVFWVAHVFSDALARQGTVHGSTHALAHAWHEARRSSIMLQAVAAPTVALSLALAGILPLALALAVSLWSGIGSLVGLSYLTMRVRQAPRARAALAGLVTGALGGAIVIGSSYVH